MFANLVGVKWYIKVPLICLIIVRENMPVGANISICVMGSTAAKLLFWSVFPRHCQPLYVYTLFLKPSCLHLSDPFLNSNQSGRGPFIRVQVSPA